jgi:adenylate kinase
LSLNTRLFILVGPPGAGKGTISQLCISQFGWVQLSTGNLCRKHIAEQTEIGKQIDFAIRSGKLVSDSLVTGAVESWFEENLGKASGVILDGYPRTVAQAQSLNDLLKTRFKDVSFAVVRLVIPDEKIVLRLCNRYVCVNMECQAVYSFTQGSGLQPKVTMVCDRCNQPLARRKDDDEQAVLERLKIYHKHEQDLLDFYEQAKLPVKEINVEKPLQDIFGEFKRLIGIEN